MTDNWSQGLSARSRRASRLMAPFGGREGFVRLDRNEDPEGWPPQHIREFLSTITAEMVASYPDPSTLTAKIADWVGCRTDEILVTNGSSEGLRLIFETFADEQATTVRLEPTYSLYELYESVAGSTNVVASYPRDLTAPIDRLLEEVDRTRPSLVTIANPDQPSGGAIGIEDIERIARQALVTGSVLAIDEAYHLFGAETAMPLVHRYSNVIIVRTFSKAFGLAGLRLGYLVGQRELIRSLKRLEPAVPPSSVSLHGGVWVLQHLSEALDRVSRTIQGRQFLAESLRRSGTPAFPSLGNFLLIPVESQAVANSIVAGSRERGFLIKGPLNAAGIPPCVRVTVGSLELMRRYWSACGTLYDHVA